MSEYNNLDNPGSGFVLEDDDFSSVLEEAAAAAEDEGAGLTQFDDEMGGDSFFDDETSSVTPKEEVASTAEVAHSSDFDDITNDDSQPEPMAPAPIMEEPVEENTPEPTPPPTIVEEVTPEPTPVAAVEETVVAEPATPATQELKRKVHVPTEADQQVETQRIIRILDTYRKLTDKEKGITVQFVTNGELMQTDDATLVVKVLNADPTLGPTMKALCEAYEAEAVERAFYTMSLSTDMLHSLGNLVSVFTQDAYEANQTNLAYSRQVVKGIASLGETEISYVRATESVLAAAENEPA